MTAFYLLVYYLSGSAYVLFGPAAVFLMYLKATIPLPRMIQKYFYYVAYPGHFFIIILINSFIAPVNI